MLPLRARALFCVGLALLYARRAMSVRIAEPGRFSPVDLRRSQRQRRRDKRRTK